MHRTRVTLVTLASVMLAVGALFAMLGGQADAQSASTAASAPSEVSAPSAASASPQDSAVEPFSTPIDNTGCEKNANNPHIATSDGPYRAKGFGEINCFMKKDELAVETTLWKKGNDGDTTWSIADRDRRACTTCFHTGIGAERACGNRNSNNFRTIARVVVYNNGNQHADIGESRVTTLNCGGF